MKKQNTRRLIRISYFTMLTIIGSMLRIPLGTMPFTLQTLFVVLSGFVLGGRDGALSQAAFLLIGLIGVPIFTQGGGISYVLQPSFGYIIGFVLGAYAAGLALSRCRTIHTFKLLLCGVIGLLAIYLVGIPYQVVILMTVNGLSFTAACLTLVNIFYLFCVDTVLIYLLCLIYPRVMSMLKSSEPQAPVPPDNISADTQTPKE